MQRQSIYLTHIMFSYKQAIYLHVVVQLAISWRSMKQVITSTSSNHAEILVIREASQECVWLRSVIQHIRGTCDLSSRKVILIILYEDNVVCIAQLKDGQIKGDRTKYTSLKFFFTRDFEKDRDINIQQIRSSDNLAYLFMKALPTAIFEKLLYNIGVCRLTDVN